MMKTHLAFPLQLERGVERFMLFEISAA